MSNVPATLLLARFTDNWESLLRGVNAGGFGSLFGSQANLIAYRLYLDNDTNGGTHRFTSELLALGYLALIVSVGLYYLVHSPA